MNSALLDFYLCPEHFVNFELAGKLSDEAGYFRCGQNATCFGRSVSGYRRNRPDVPLYDTLADIGVHHGEPVLPFDPTEVIDNYDWNVMRTRMAAACGVDASGD